MRAKSRKSCPWLLTRHDNTSNKISNSSRYIAAKHFLKTDAARFSTRVQTCLASKQSCCSWVNPDFWLANTTTWLHATLSCCKTSWSMVVISAASTSFVAKGRTILYYLQQTFSTCNRFFWCETSLYARGRTCNIVFQPVLQQCCETSWRILLLVLTCLNIQTHCFYSRFKG